jgi:hypothetical protein
MKKLLLLSVFLIFACSNDDESDDNPLPAYTVEGRWLWSPGFGASANTMYEFLNGTRYTYYCDDFGNECDETYWNSLETLDAIPGTITYTFETNILTIDSVEQEVAFECDGGKLYFVSANYSLYRIGVDQDCN